MSNDRCRFKLGDFECLAIRDVSWGNVDTGWFPNIPAEVSQPLLEQFYGNPDSFPNAMTCLAYRYFVRQDSELLALWHSKVQISEPRNG